MMRWQVLLTLDVAECWVQDGFDAAKMVRDGRFQDRIGSTFLGYARSHEFVVGAQVLKEPSPALVTFETGRYSERVNEKPSREDGHTMKIQKKDRRR